MPLAFTMDTRKNYCFIIGAVFISFEPKSGVLHCCVFPMGHFRIRMSHKRGHGIMGIPCPVFVFTSLAQTGTLLDPPNFLRPCCSRKTLARA